MISKKPDNPRLAAIVIPRDESNCCVKVVPLHLLQKTFIVDIPIGLPQPRIVDCKVCVVMRCVPTSFAGAISNEHHCRCDSEKSIYNTFIRQAIVWRYVTSHEYFQSFDPSLNQYRGNLLVVPHAH